MNWNWALALKRNASKFEFAAKACLVNRLKEPGSKGTMYFESRIYHDASNCIGLLRYRNLATGLNTRFEFLGDLGVLGGSSAALVEAVELIPQLI